MDFWLIHILVYNCQYELGMWWVGHWYGTLWLYKDASADGTEVGAHVARQAGSRRLAFSVLLTPKRHLLDHKRDGVVHVYYTTIGIINDIWVLCLIWTRVRFRHWSHRTSCSRTLFPISQSRTKHPLPASLVQWPHLISVLHKMNYRGAI